MKIIKYLILIILLIGLISLTSIFFIIHSNSKLYNFRNSKLDDTEKVVERDAKGRIIKTSSDSTIRIYDSIGRMIKCYGHVNDFDGNFRYVYFNTYTEGLISVKYYTLDSTNINYKINSNSKYYLEYYYYKGKKLKKNIKKFPKKDSEGNITHYKIEVENHPWSNPYINNLPEYIK